MNISNAGSLMVIAAHPDDEVLGCAATVRKLIGRGWNAHLVILSAGVSGRVALDHLESDTVKKQQASLGMQIRKSAQIIGYKTIDTFDFPDNRMDTVSKMDLSLAIRPVIERERPGLVFTHHPGDYNWDHAATFEAAMMAARCNVPDFFPTEIRTFEVLSATERAWQHPSRIFCPNLYVDVASSIDMKKLAMQSYTDEYRPYPHPRSIEAIEFLARKRGNEVGLPYAEAFHIVRRVEQ